MSDEWKDYECEGQYWNEFIMYKISKCRIENPLCIWNIVYKDF